MPKQQVYDGTLKKFVEIEVEDIDTSAIELEQTTDGVRFKRNNDLSQSDWTTLTDNQLTDEQKAEAITYRQALRDLPEQEGFPHVEFPTKPDFL
tara:strand:- start:195 stop:476 length:282 start_codon:yes stop_codon:yes gene_type:complete